MIQVGRKTTMTVQELIDFLKTQERTRPVFAAWEGVRASIRPSDFEREVIEGHECLVVDVEDYFR